jgi:hypothetical protein
MNAVKHPIAIWSDVSPRVLHAILEECEGRLPVIAAIEQDSPVDRKAIMILADISKFSFLGTPANLGGNPAQQGPRYTRIGYLCRNAEKDQIADWLLGQPDLAIHGQLILNGADYRFNWETLHPDVIPF